MASKLPPPKERRTYGYARISISDPAGSSLETQRSKIEALATVTGREPVAEIFEDDGRTGANTDRPGFQRLVALIEAGEVEAVIVAKLDRLTRSLRDALDFLELLEKHGTKFLSASEMIDTSTPTGRLLLQVLFSFAEFERESIVARVKTGLTHKRKSGKVYSGIAPYGFERDGDNLVECATEQPILARMKAMRADGASFEEIADALNADGAPTRGGGTWYRQRINKILRGVQHRAA